MSYQPNELELAIENLIEILVKLKTTTLSSNQNPLEIIKLVVCGLDTLLKAIIKWIPVDDKLALKILGAIESILSIACAVIPVAKESV